MKRGSWPMGVCVLRTDQDREGPGAEPWGPPVEYGRFSHTVTGQ